MNAQITQNTFCTYTGSQGEVPHTTIFFISGNPGLVSYYHPFLSLLGQHLSPAQEEQKNGKHDTEKSASSSPSIQIYGCSLGGFEVNPESTSQKLYNLEDQIQFVHNKLETLMVTNKHASTSANGTPKPSPASKHKVILIGHSVGAYIAMEILRRHREADSAPESQAQNTSSDFDIIGGAMLFPTVMHIAASPSGQKLTRLLSVIPSLALIVGLFARLLVQVLPTAVLKAAIKLVMHDPPAHALDATATFLSGCGHVQQALHMAADEMRTITSDKWTDDVWGVAHTREPLTKLFFYFGRGDHWVAEETREEIIALRGHGPRMVVCEEGLPHAFCLKHSDFMARKVAGMIGEIVGGGEFV
ncbi:hypothetical protein N7462_003330 [Penicillium macrosclerotiorum]|uniref:uncharacterized protein n=1 Tax=Penicillium macrosclerotiorum TaxID=303699 RepID=UPI0025492695|nr:uncharacterized protein N7462_003330 [Penicillium macrosclerotiorum]KAJ5688938.1 hypothetical protein N7462_003330 [Penicillium macrosclerotiorum]